MFLCDRGCLDDRRRRDPHVAQARRHGASARGAGQALVRSETSRTATMKYLKKAGMAFLCRFLHRNAEID